MNVKIVIKTISLVFFFISTNSMYAAGYIKLLTYDGHEVLISTNIAEQSPVLKNHLTASGTDFDEAFPIGPVTKPALELIVACLQALNAANQTTIKRADGGYIAQRIQPIIDGVCASSANTMLGNATQAAGFLELEYLANAFIRTLMQKMLSENPALTIANINDWRSQNAVLESKFSPLIEYQYNLVKNGKIPELNITDYIALYGMPQVQNRGLDLNGKNITSLTGLSTINGIAAIENLYLKNNKLFILEQGQLTGLPNLTDLYLENNKLITITPGVLGSMPKLRGLYLSYNNFSILKPGTFAGASALALLNLDHNPLLIFQGTFAGLTNLQILRLNNDELTSLAPGALSTMPKLLDIYLENNQLNNLDRGAFSGPTLRKIDLRNNPILQTMSLAEFKRVFSLDATSLAGAFRPSDAGVQIATTSTASTQNNQKLSIADYIAIYGMPIIQNKTLDLSGKGLTNLEGLNTIKGIADLESVNLSNNKLTVVPKDTFEKFTSLKDLNLSSNKLTKVEMVAFNAPNLKTLNLSYNKDLYPDEYAFIGLPNLKDLDLQQTRVNTQRGWAGLPEPRELERIRYRYTPGRCGSGSCNR